MIFTKQVFILSNEQKVYSYMKVSCGNVTIPLKIY